MKDRSRCQDSSAVGKENRSKREGSSAFEDEIQVGAESLVDCCIRR